MAVIEAVKVTDMSGTMPQTFSGGAVDMRRFPVTLPLVEIVGGLNTYQPTVLNTYPTVLHPLAAAVQTGELRIAPATVVSIAEPLLPEIRAAAERAWNVPVINVWARRKG